MNKSLYLYTLFLSVCVSFQIFSQSYSVPSPSASQMTRYSGASINESSGRVSASIPIYKYQAGNISVPVGLSYIGNGVKVDQQSNWVGTNWLLSSGGVVTRVVNHLPDETATNRLFAEDNAFLSDNINNALYIKDLIDGVNTTDDMRPDLFSFSFPGGSGTFYLDKNNVPRLMNANSEMKIEFQASPTDPNLLNTILIKTPMGVKYYFGGDNASESSSTLVDVIERGLGSGDVDFTVFPKAITAFYLYKIEHPFGDVVHFEYHDDGDKQYVMFEGDQINKLDSAHNHELDSECESELEPNQNNQIQHSIYRGKIYNRKKISRIYSPETNIEILFNSSPLLLELTGSDPFSTPEYDDRVLNSVQVYNSFLNETIKHVKLDYITTTSRIFLEEVSINNENDPLSTNTCSVYHMDYDNPGQLPPRFSTSQDLLGYYNGYANPNMLPQNFDPEFEGIFSNLANRSINFNYVKKGSLTKIIYPSGGNTTFQYEAPQVMALTPVLVDLEAYRNQNNRIPTTQVEETGEIGDPYPELGSTPLHVPTDQSIVVRVNVEADLPINDHNEKVYIELNNITTGTTQSEYLNIGLGQSTYNQTFNFDLDKNNSYTLRVYLDPFTPSSTAIPYTVSAHTYYIANKQYDAYGIRVSRIIEKPDDVSEAITKRYYYKRAEKAFTAEEDDESAVVTYEPPTIIRNYIEKPCCPTIYGTSIYSYVSLMSNPFAYFFSGADNQVSYRYVTVSLGGDLFEEGGVEKQFRIEKPTDPTVISNPIFVDPDALESYSEKLFLGGFSDNNYIFNGAPEKVTHIKNEVGTLYKVEETEYTYNLSELDKTEGIILAIHTKDCLTQVSELYASTLFNYNNFSYDFDLTNVTTKEYIEHLPPVIPPPEHGIAPEAPITITTTQDITYSSALQGLPKTITTTNSNGEAQIVKNYYLTTSDLASLSGLSALELSAYNTLIAEDRIGFPVQVETYFKKAGSSTEELRSTQRTVFKDYAGLILPEKTQSSKFNFPLENGATYHNYDNDGRPLESSAEDDISTSVIYGYKDKRVIAELVNLSYGDIPASTITNLQNLSEGVTNVTTMNTLKSALDQLRLDFPQARINTYVYNRLGQLDSMKDNRGYEVSYIYDSCYRLIQVRDQDGNIVEEHNYNITTNN